MTITLPEPKEPVVPPSLPENPENPKHKMGFWRSLQQRTPLGWLQLKKSKSRTLVAIAGIAFADLLIFAQLGIQAALFASNTLLNSSLNADIIIRSTQYRDLSLTNTFSRRRLYQIQSVEGVQTADALYLGTVVWRNPETLKKTQLTLIGSNLERPAFDFPEVRQNLPKLQQPNSFLFDRLARGNYRQVITQVEQGKYPSTEIDRHSIRVVGLFTLGASFATDGTLITSQNNFLRLFPDRGAGEVTLGLVKVKEGEDVRKILAQIQAILPQDTIASTQKGYVEFEQAYVQKKTPIGLIFGFGAIMSFVVGMVIVFQILSTDVNEHLGEYATFKAIGYSDQYLLFIVIEEAMILAMLGFILGLILTIGQYALLAHLASLRIAMTFSRFVFVFFLTVVMCVGSGTIATLKLKSADPADIF